MRTGGLTYIERLHLLFSFSLSPSLALSLSHSRVMNSPPCPHIPIFPHPVQWHVVDTQTPNIRHLGHVTLPQLPLCKFGTS